MQVRGGEQWLADRWLARADDRQCGGGPESQGHLCGVGVRLRVRGRCRATVRMRVRVTGRVRGGVG